MPVFVDSVTFANSIPTFFAEDETFVPAFFAVSDNSVLTFFAVFVILAPVLLRRKVDEATLPARENALEARMRFMTPKERDEFAAAAVRIAKELNAKEAEGTKAPTPAEVLDAAAEAAKDAAAAVEGVAQASAEAVKAVVEQAEEAGAETAEPAEA